MTVALSGCSTFTNRDVVARVNGADITVDEFEPLAAEYFGTPEVFGATPVQYGRGDADQARPLATVLVQRELLDHFFEQQAQVAAGTIVGRGNVFDAIREARS